MQDAVFPLHINAARRDIHDVAVTVGDGGDQRAGRRIILPVGGIGIRDDVPGFRGTADDGPCAGFYHRDIKAGVCPGRQQVGVVTDHAVITASQPAVIERYARGAQGEQAGKV